MIFVQCLDRAGKKMIRVITNDQNLIESDQVKKLRTDEGKEMVESQPRILGDDLDRSFYLFECIYVKLPFKCFNRGIIGHFSSKCPYPKGEDSDDEKDYNHKEDKNKYKKEKRWKQENIL